MPWKYAVGADKIDFVVNGRSGAPEPKSGAYGQKQTALRHPRQSSNS